MKLYEVPRNTKVRVVNAEEPPPGAPSIKSGEEYMFNHIDGMYSYCKDKDNQVVHLAAWTEVEVVND